MGNYIEITDLDMSQDDLIKLTDEENTGDIDETKVNSAITEAEGEINGYAKTNYTIPFFPVPDIIKKITKDIAKYNLYGLSQNGATEDVKDRHKNAIKFLENLARGLVTIGEDTPVAASESGIKSTLTKVDRTFTKDTLANF